MKKNQSQKQSTKKLSITVLVTSAVAMVVLLILLVIINNDFPNSKIADSPASSLNSQPGDLVKENIVGKYTTAINTVDGRHQITLTLDSAGTASLLEVLADGRENVESGTWQITNGADKIVVNIAQQSPLQFIYVDTNPRVLQYQIGGNLGWQASLKLTKQEGVFAYKWQWLSTVDQQQKVVLTPPQSVFGLEFEQDGNLLISTDCNFANGSFQIDGQQISFTNIASTLKYCQNSKETDFLAQLELAKNYQLENQRLTINLSNGQTMIFVGTSFNK